MDEAMFVVLECVEDGEYEQIMSLMASNNYSPYMVADDVSQFCSCPKPSFDYTYSNQDSHIPIETVRDPYAVVPKCEPMEESAPLPEVSKTDRTSSLDRDDGFSGSPLDRKRKSIGRIAESAEKRLKRLLPTKFHEFLLEMLMSPRNAHLVHFSGTVDPKKKNGLQFTIPNRKIFADVWGRCRGIENYSHIALVNKDLWNAQHAGIVKRVLFRDPLLIYRFEPSAHPRFDRTLTDLGITLQDVYEYAYDYTNKNVHK